MARGKVYRIRFYGCALNLPRYVRIKTPLDESIKTPVCHLAGLGLLDHSPPSSGHPNQKHLYLVFPEGQLLPAVMGSTPSSGSWNIRASVRDASSNKTLEASLGSTGGSGDARGSGSAKGHAISPQEAKGSGDVRGLGSVQGQAVAQAPDVNGPGSARGQAGSSVEAAMLWAPSTLPESNYLASARDPPPTHMLHASNSSPALLTYRC